MGWFFNLYQLVTNIPETFAVITPLWVFKLLGVIVFPLGGALGWVGLF